MSKREGKSLVNLNFPSLLFSPENVENINVPDPEIFSLGHG